MRYCVCAEANRKQIAGAFQIRPHPGGLNQGVRSKRLSAIQPPTISLWADRRYRNLQHLPENSLDVNLAAAKKGSLFYVAGQQRLREPFTLFVSQEGDGTAREPFAAKGLVMGTEPLGNDAIDVLLNVAQPAPFGRRGEVVLDPTYRNALRLLPGTFGLSATLPTQAMMKDISSLMAPDGTRIYAQLDKLNIYGPGGMFQRHVDTPINNSHFGSLVVALPFAFEGGELVVRNGDAAASLPLGGGKGPASGGSTAAAAASTSAPAGAPTSSSLPPAEQPAEGPVLHFAAFFSDLEHEVLPVTSGHRVTVTYNLFFDREKRVLSVAEPLSGCYNPLVTELSRLLSQETWHPEGVTMGFMLHHQYARSFAEVTDNMFPAVLKGVDRLLYAAMCETLGLKGGFRPVHLTEKRKGMVIDNLPNVYVGKSFDTDAEIISNRGLEETSLEEFMQENGFDPAEEMDVLWVGLRDTAEAAFRLKSDVMAYGNDWYMSTFYSGVALLVELPPWRSGARERAIKAAQRGLGAMP